LLQPSRVIVCFLVLGLLAACAPATPAASPVPTALTTPVPTATPVPRPTPTLEPQALQAALFKAVQTDDLDATTALIAAGADVNAEGDFNLTPMDVASTRANPAMVRLLLEAGASWEIETFHKAITAGDLETVEIFLDAGADPSERSGQWGFHALLFAAQYGHTEIGELLIDRGADVYLSDNWGDCALNVAAYFGQLEFVTMLLDRGVTVDTPNARGKTALIHSIGQKHADVEAVLRAAGAAE
jgi:ankyrin repeat protein